MGGVISGVSVVDEIVDGFVDELVDELVEEVVDEFVEQVDGEEEFDRFDRFQSELECLSA